MLNFRRCSSQLKRAALIGVLVAAFAHFPPFYLAQRVDGAVLAGYSRVVPGPDDDIVVINLARADAMPIVASGTRATIIGPDVLALGPVRSALWSDTLPWAIALAGIAALLGVSARGEPRLRRFVLSTPPALVTLSFSAFAAGGVWIPVAGPALLLLTTGLLGGRRSRPVPPPGARTAPDPGTALQLLRSGKVEAAWRAYRNLPASQELLPELYELGLLLASQGYAHLAADAFLRAALVDVDYRDVAARLALSSRPDGFADAASRQRARAGMPAAVGRYRLLEPVGEGTMGRVFLARDPKISRLVAIKLIDLTREPGDAEDADRTERFLREAETTGRLSHPNIVTVYDVGESDGGAYIAMEFLKGELLSRFTRPDTLLPPALVLELGALIADALDYAHGHNVIHRDIKPGNIMYDSISGDLKITDFGIARLIDVRRTQTGVVLGTPSFMSPEQIEGGNVKGHTDLFALGVSLYELLTGQLPFRGNSMTKLMFVIANEPHEPVTAVRADLPRDLDGVIDTALAKDPQARFPRGSDMAIALRTAREQLA